jgi:plastocyanin
MTTHDESHIIRTSPKRMAQGLAIVVGVLVFGAIILVLNWNQMVEVPPPVSSIAVQPPDAGTTSETQGTTTTTATEGGAGAGAGGGAPAPVAGVTINIPTGASVQGSPDYDPDTAEVPMNEKVVWVNEDTVPHTATSGTGLEDPDSGTAFDTSIINGGESSAPQELKGVNEGDEIPYYCSVHPYMTSKLTVTAASAGGGGSAATDTNATTTNATTTATGAATQGGGAATPAETTTTAAAAAATLTIPMGAVTPGNPAYEPASLTVKKGDAIDVVNEDSSPHTVTSGTGLEDPNAGQMFDTSIITPAASAQLATADLEAGEYDYHCSVHPFMTGKLIVQ